MAKTPATKAKAKAKALYEAGGSLREISTKVGKHYQTILAWSKKEGWIQGKTRPGLDQKEESALEAEAERHGVTRGRILAKVGELLDAKSIAAVTTQGAISLCPLPANSDAKLGEKADVAGIQADVVPDRATQIAAAKMGIDVLGMKRVQVDPSDGFREFFQGLRGAK